MSLPHPAAVMADELPPGTLVGGGRFVIEAIIGRGGVATVYRARTKTNERLALKVMLDTRASDPAQRERFDNESRILDALAGAPYVVRMLEAGRLSERGDRPFIAMELVRGPTLDRLIHGDRVKARARVDRACRVVRQVANALVDLHERGVVHRDIKPENIVVEQGGTIRLLDFGYAHSGGAGPMPDTAGLTRTEHRPGTYLYMAPEQAIGLSAAPSFDIYALAVTLYEALAGHAPNHELPLAEMARLKCEMREPELSISGRVFGVPSELAALVDAGLRRVPAERIASALEFRDRLDEIIATLPPESGEELELAVVRLSGSPSANVVEQADVETEKAPRTEPRNDTEDAPRASPAGAKVVGTTEPVMAARPSVATELTPRAAEAAAVPERSPSGTRRTEPATMASASEGSRPGSTRSRFLGLVGVVLVAAAVIVLWSVPSDSEGTASTNGGAGSGAAPVAASIEDDASSDADEEADLPRPDLPSHPAQGPAADDLADPSPDAIEESPPSEAPPTTAPSKPTLPRSAVRPCDDVDAKATAEADARRYAKVLQLTRSSRCWQDSNLRMVLRVQALSELGRFEECVKAGRGTTAPGIRRLVKHCEKQLEAREPQ